VALREVKEESGVVARPVTEQIYSAEILTVDGHEKHGKYVPLAPALERHLSA
jgi:8-oxo-dGTP pyrophosphatase MutT (NUDIX family)